MKGAKELKAVIIPKLIAAMKTPETRARFLAFEKYKDAKKFVRVDLEAGSSVTGNGQHFLDIMTEALTATSDPSLTKKFNELRAANHTYRNKRAKQARRNTKVPP